MEEFFYLILVVVWLIISVYKRKSKQVPPAGQSQPRQQPQGTVPEEKDMEELLEEFFGRGKKQQPQPAESFQDEVQTQIPETERETREREYYYEELQQQDHEQVAEFEDYSGIGGVSKEFEFSSESKAESIEDLIKLHARQDAQQQAIDEQTYGRDSDSDIPEFDLKTAVVFSEILNRKYT